MPDDVVTIDDGEAIVARTVSPSSTFARAMSGERAPLLNDVVPSRLSLAATARASIASHAAECYPLEACGLVVGEVGASLTTVTRIVRCANIAPVADRTRRFAIDPIEVIRVRDTFGPREALLGFYHSHPDHPAIPSALDATHMRDWPGAAWLIAAVWRGAPTEPRAWTVPSLDEADVHPIEIAIV